MAPRKCKPQGKRNNVKIKSKAGSSRKRETKSGKKTEPSEKPVTSLKWLNKAVAQGNVKKADDGLPDWFKNNDYKRSYPRADSDVNTSEYEEYPPQDVEDKYSGTPSDASEECNCPRSKYSETNKGGILKMKASSSNSLVAKYIRSGMNQVASFIVESAIRFGEQHGVVIPDKNTPNLYEVTPPDSKFSDKCRKIRFKFSEKSLGCDKGKAMWKNYNKSGKPFGKRAQTPIPDWDAKHRTKSSSWESTADSLEEILPILEKLKEGGDIVTSDLNLEKLRKSQVDEEDKNRDWGRDRERERERVRERARTCDRGRERLRERLRRLRKRYKSLGAVPEKNSGENEYEAEERNRWKKRRDSLELGRQRMWNGTCPRKQESMTPSPY